MGSDGSDEIQVFMTSHYANFKVRSNRSLKKFYALLRNISPPKHSAFTEMYGSRQSIILGNYLFK